MPRSRAPYPPEYRQQMVDRVRGGRTPEELSREFEPTAQSIWNWVRQAELDGGVRSDGLTTEEKEELRRLRRENRVPDGESVVGVRDLVLFKKPLDRGRACTWLKFLGDKLSNLSRLCLVYSVQLEATSSLTRHCGKRDQHRGELKPCLEPYQGRPSCKSCQ